jgi:hypothetical protein
LIGFVGWLVLLVGFVGCFCLLFLLVGFVGWFCCLFVVCLLLLLLLFNFFVLLANFEVPILKKGLRSIQQGVHFTETMLSCGGCKQGQGRNKVQVSSICNSNNQPMNK